MKQNRRSYSEGKIIGFTYIKQTVLFVSLITDMLLNKRQKGACCFSDK